MTFSRLLKNSIGVAALAGLTLAPATSLLAQVQPYSPSDQYGPPPNQNQGQYAPPAPDQQQQYAPAPDQQYAPDQQQDDTEMQNGAPQAVEQAPPPIPDYAQPQAPGDGYIWTPGYWAWTSDGYVWVDGAWVMPPYSDALWTPGYWGYNPYGYYWNAGYWGPVVGYYGGINYGWGYFGIGFWGGYWHGGHFWYNRAYSNIGYGRGFNAYNRSYRGFSGRPGGSSFAHTNNRSAGFAGSRGSAINGRSYATHSSGFAQGRSSYAARGNARSYSTPRANYSAPRSSARSYSAPRASGGGGYRGGGGGSFHGGGGGSHAGGGGGGGSHGGGGHR